MKRKKDGYSDSELPMLLQSMASLSLVVVFCVGGFFGIGYLLDKYIGTGVAGMVVATFVGAGVAIFWAYKRVSLTLRRIYKEDVSANVEKEAAGKADSAKVDTENAGPEEVNIGKIDVEKSITKRGTEAK